MPLLFFLRVSSIKELANQDLPFHHGHLISMGSKMLGTLQSMPTALRDLPMTLQAA